MQHIAIKYGQLVTNLLSKILIEYEAPIDQIRALIDISERCWQSIEFQCFAAPLNIDENHHLGQWIDYKGRIKTNRAFI